MFPSSLLVASTLLLTTALADSSPYSKFINDANSLLAAATASDAAQLNALYTWQATQTAIPSDEISSQYQEYLNAFTTTTSAPLPAWMTAVPSSLQPIASSFLQAEASLVVQDIAPIVSQNNAEWYLNSANQAAPATISSESTPVPTSAPSATASTGFVIGPTNITTSSMSANGTAPPVSANGTATASITSITTASGSPTKPITQPKTTFKGGAEKPAGAAAAAAVVGIMGIVVLL